MTVIGFGRRGLEQLLRGRNTLSLGVIQEGLEFAAVQQRVRGIEDPPTCEVGRVFRS